MSLNGLTFIVDTAIYFLCFIPSNNHRRTCLIGQIAFFLSVCLKVILMPSVCPNISFTSICFSLYVYLFQSICLSVSVYMSICFSLYVYLFQSICLSVSVYMSICFSLYVYLFQSICLSVSVYMSICFSLYVYLFQSICLSVSVYMSICFSLYVYLFQSICLSVSVYLSFPKYLSLSLPLSGKILLALISYTFYAYSNLAQSTINLTTLALMRHLSSLSVFDQDVDSQETPVISLRSSIKTLTLRKHLPFQ